MQQFAPNGGKFYLSIHGAVVVWREENDADSRDQTNGRPHAIVVPKTIAKPLPKEEFPAPSAWGKM